MTAGSVAGGWRISIRNGCHTGVLGGGGGGRSNTGKHLFITIIKVQVDGLRSTQS